MRIKPLVAPSCNFGFENLDGVSCTHSVIITSSKFVLFLFFYPFVYSRLFDSRTCSQSTSGFLPCYGIFRRQMKEASYSGQKLWALFYKKYVLSYP